MQMLLSFDFGNVANNDNEPNAVDYIVYMLELCKKWSQDDVADNIKIKQVNFDDVVVWNDIDWEDIACQNQLLTKS